MNTAKKLWRLLTRKQRGAAVSLVALMIVGMILEMLSVGLVLPALALITRGVDLSSSSNSVRVFFEMLGNPTPEQLVIYGMLVLVVVYTVKSLFLGFLVWKQMSFVYGTQAEVSFQLFYTYLRQPYSFHLQRNSAQLIQNAVNEVHVFCHLLLNSVLILLTEGFVLLGVAAVLIAIEPKGSLIVVGIVAGLGYLFHLATNGMVLRWGEARQFNEGRRIQHLQQGLGGVKDVLVLGRENEFLEQYQKHNLTSADVSRKRETLHQMPRLGLEMLAVVALATLVILMLGRGSALSAILPTIGLFAAAGFRIMPSVNRVINALHNVRFARPVIDTLHQEMLLPVPSVETRSQRVPFEKCVELKDVTYTYPGATTPALQHIDLKILRGHTVGFIGGSGAGKSTLVDVLLGLLPPGTGRVAADGIDINANSRGWQRNIGYVPQAIFLTDDTLRRNIAFGIASDSIDESAVWQAVKAAQLGDYIASLPDGLDTIVGERGTRLSGGQLQRVGIARALYHDPPVLVLDEATSSLDSATERGVMGAVGELRGRKTIIIVAHRLTTLSACDRIFRLEQGQLVAEGTVETMIGASSTIDTERAAEIENQH